MHILLSINVTAAGRALHASRRLLGGAPIEAVEDSVSPEGLAASDLVAPALANRDSMFEAARQKLCCDDDETTAPSFSEGSCGDVFDDGWEKDLAGH